MFELMAQPSRYSAEEIEELLSSGDTREVYNLLCMAGGAVASNGEDADVDAEWRAFARRHSGGGLRELWRSRRVAAIAAIACTSLAAVAIGIAIGVSSLERREATAEVPAKELAMDAVAEGTEALADKGEMDDFSEPILFEDAPLKRILRSVGERYGVEVDYAREEAGELHLYYRFDPSLPLRDIVEQLNTFEQIKLRLQGGRLIVE